MNYNTLTIFYAIWGFVGMLLVVMLLLFILDAVARYRYLKVRGYDKCWMAFVPLANMWATVEATYGDQEKINIYGWRAPAIVLKLWAVSLFFLLLIAGRIPVIGRLIALAVWVANIAVFIQVYRDMMERLYCEQSVGDSVIAVLIHFVSSFKIMGASRRYGEKELDFRKDERELGSQKVTEGVLSFMNGR